MLRWTYHGRLGESRGSRGQHRRADGDQHLQWPAPGWSGPMPSADDRAGDRPRSRRAGAPAPSTAVKSTGVAASSSLESRRRGDVRQRASAARRWVRRSEARRAERSGHPRRGGRARRDPRTDASGLQRHLEHQLRPHRRWRRARPRLLRRRVPHHPVEDGGVRAGIGIVELPVARSAGRRSRGGRIPPPSGPCWSRFSAWWANLWSSRSRWVRDGLARGGRGGLHHLDHGIHRHAPPMR